MLRADAGQSTIIWETMDWCTHFAIIGSIINSCGIKYYKRVLHSKVRCDLGVYCPVFIIQAYKFETVFEHQNVQSSFPKEECCMTTLKSNGCQGD